MKKIMVLLLFTVFMTYNIYAQNIGNNLSGVLYEKKNPDVSNKPLSTEEIFSIEHGNNKDYTIYTNIPNSSWVKDCQVGFIRIISGKAIAEMLNCSLGGSQIKGFRMVLNLGKFNEKSTNYAFESISLAFLLHKQVSFNVSSPGNTSSKNGNINALDVVN